LPFRAIAATAPEKAPASICVCCQATMRLLYQQQISETEARPMQRPVANSQEAIPLVGQGAYDAYKDKARDVAVLFTEATGIPVREPSLDPRMS
jgi:hypothetical protein